MKAKKFIENVKQGEYEFIKNHLIDVPVEIFDLRNLVDDVGCYDDPEMAVTTYGVAIDFTDDIYSVDITEFVNGVEGRYEDELDEMPEYAKSLLEVLKQYKGYTLYP